jgi:hypothetical protein
MFSNEIDYLVRQFPELDKRYLGTFARDQVRRVPFKAFSFAICNAQDSTSPGSHWYLIICVPNEGKELKFEVWDSLGVNRRILAENKVLPSYVKVFKCNHVRLQPIGSQMCGQFAVFFAHMRLSNTDLSQKMLIR